MNWKRLLHFLIIPELIAWMCMCVHKMVNRPLCYATWFSLILPPLNPQHSCLSFSILRFIFVAVLFCIYMSFNSCSIDPQINGFGQLEASWPAENIKRESGYIYTYKDIYHSNDDGRQDFGRCQRQWTHLIRSHSSPDWNFAVFLLLVIIGGWSQYWILRLCDMKRTLTSPLDVSCGRLIFLMCDQANAFI